MCEQSESWNIAAWTDGRVGLVRAKSFTSWRPVEVDRLIVLRKPGRVGADGSLRASSVQSRAIADAQRGVVAPAETWVGSWAGCDVWSQKSP